MFIETETTPNPATLKFLPGRTLLAAGSREFTSSEAAAASPLAAALFMLAGVTGVLIGRDFIAVTAADPADWPTLKPSVVAVLLDHLIAEAPLFIDAALGQEAARHDAAEHADHAPEDAEIVAQILDLIETRIRPAVANDGGDVRFRGFREGVVYLAMQGACSGCPSSTATLKHGIESLIKHYVPEVHEVCAA